MGFKEQPGDVLIRLLPKPIQSALVGVAVLAGWIALANAIVSLIERLHWAQFVSREAIEALGPLLADWFSDIWSYPHSIIVMWRKLTEPLLAMFWGWISVDLQGLALDTTIIATILLGAGIRRELRLYLLRRSAQRKLDEVLNDYRQTIKRIQDEGPDDAELSYMHQLMRSAKSAEQLRSVITKVRSPTKLSKARDQALVDVQAVVVKTSRLAQLFDRADEITTELRAINFKIATTVSFATILSACILIDLVLVGQELI